MEIEISHGIDILYHDEIIYNQLHNLIDSGVLQMLMYGHNTPKTFVYLFDEDELRRALP